MHQPGKELLEYLTLLNTAYGMFKRTLLLYIVQLWYRKRKVFFSVFFVRINEGDIGVTVAGVIRESPMLYIDTLILVVQSLTVSDPAYNIFMPCHGFQL